MPVHDGLGTGPGIVTNMAGMLRLTEGPAG